MRHKQTDEHKLWYFWLKAILNTILRMENTGQIYRKHKIHVGFMLIHDEAMLKER